MGELNTNFISVGNWSRNSQGVLQFIEVGEGISDGTEQGPEETPMAVDKPTNNQEELEDQPVGDHEEQQNSPAPTVTTVMASGRVSRPPTCLIKEIGEAALTAVNETTILLLVN